MKLEKLNMEHYLQWAIHIIYPERCPLCDGVIYRPLGEREYRVCNDCGRTISYIGEPVCKKCGKPLTDERREYCGDCSRKEHKFIQGKALWLYKGAVQQSVYRFKYGGRREYAKFYGQELTKHYAAWLKRCQLDAIIPIPLHKKRKNQRGYNQAELLAKEIGKYLNIPVNTSLLLRAVNTRPQKELNDKERKNNLKRAFKITENNVQLNNILLVDDIYTTGSTMDSAAAALRAAGVQKVFVISVCIGNGY